jgi:hypothetical protein
MRIVQRKQVLGGFFAVALLLGLLPLAAAAEGRGLGQAMQADTEPEVVEVVSNPRTDCLPGDRPESGLQGGVPGFEKGPPDGFQGFNCAVDVVGQHTLNDRGSFGSTAFINWGDQYCNYSSMRTPSDLDDPDTGTMVLDLSVPSEPRLVDILRTPAMLRAYSALYIESGLMAGAFQNGDDFDIYNVSDCLNPSFEGHTITAGDNHDGWLTPDGTTYYGVQFGGGSVLENPEVEDIHVTDVSDPTNPTHLLTWNRAGTYGTGDLPPDVFERVAPTRNFHDASTNEDGTRLYLALYGGIQPLGGGPGEAGRCANGLMILDSSDVAERRPNPKLEFISFLSWCDDFDPEYLDGATAATHTTRYGIHENGMEYVLVTKEQFALTGSPEAACNQRSYARLVDVSDELNPRVVSKWNPEANRPANCETVLAEDYTVGMTHYVDVDDRYNTRLVFYAAYQQGIRVVDYGDPENPKEVGYFRPPNHPTLTDTDATDATAPDPPYDLQNCFIHSGFRHNGLIILELTDPVYNPCMRKNATGGGWVTGDDGARIPFSFNARRQAAGPHGQLRLRAPEADIQLNDVSFLGSVRDECGSVFPTGSALQFDGTGTFNGASAQFRVCVEDNSQGSGADADLLFVTCTSGCDHSADYRVGGGDIQVRWPTNGYIHQNTDPPTRPDPDTGP